MLIHSVNGVYLIENTPFLTLTEEAITTEVKAPERINQENLGVKITADKFFVLDVDSGMVLMEKNSNIPQPIASITKLMTALVILDQEPDWQLSVEMIKADETKGAYPHIYRGEEILFIDLWKSALIASDNNSIMAMVRTLDLSEDEFVELMNLKAEEIKLYNTEFDDPTGLSELNTSTATDVAKLIYYTMQRNEIRESVIQGNYKFPIQNSKKTRRITTTDILIDSFLNSTKYGYEFIGGKTGYIPEAGYCLAVQVTKDEHPVIVVVLNSDTINTRFQDTKVLTDWVFTNYEWR